MIQITTANIVSSIAQLPRNRTYNYINPVTRNMIEIVDVSLPEGPIVIKRYNPANGGSSSNSTETSISTQMIQRVANAILPNQPINFDRVLGASYNTRSALESLMAHTPQFFYCYPGRIDSSHEHKVSRGHKHLMWLPAKPHSLGIMEEIKTSITISEIPAKEIYYDSLVIPNDEDSSKLDIDIKRRHSQIQIALIMIGQQLGFRTWIAQNDKGIIYNNQRIAEMPGVVDSLQQEKLIYPHDGAVKSALLIDCIWFKNGKLMPAVMEVEHSTGVTSGLTRMKNLYDHIPAYSQTRYVIVAPDEDRKKVFKEANKPQFEVLNTKFFPYSAVEELYSLCQRRKIRGITEEFLDSFMEPTIESQAPTIYN
ncbi:restriction endonuclease [Psychrobacillus antarcticus]|uniref:restriction endonuclease n=1 Tax=Psychrobacillus antarcticus TaxID=2879115 RepID=UPI002407FEB6|nr:restriction endonuclease [Psychrobacillus antarcticus]